MARISTGAARGGRPGRDREAASRDAAERGKTNAMLFRRSLARCLPIATIVALLGACAASRPAVRPTAKDRTVPTGWTRRAFAVPDHGNLLLSIPPGWTASEGEGEGEAAAVPAIRLGAPGHRFAATLTPLWNPGEPEAAEARADTALLFADLGRRNALGGSAEQEIPLEELSGPGVKGFWFTATDRECVGREPGPEEWRNIVQGAAAVGPVIVAFTLLDDGPGPQRSLLLDIVRTARHEDEGGDEGEDEGEELGELDPVPDALTVPLRIAWPGKRWAVLVDLPGFKVGARKAGEGRGPFALGLHPATGIAASVTLVPSAAAKDAGGCRDEALAAIAGNEPKPANVLKEGPRVTYTILGAASAGVVETHAHAFLHREGLCANVHASKMAPSPEDAARIEAILSSARFAEDL